MKRLRLSFLSRVNLLLVALIGLLGAGCGLFPVDYGVEPSVLEKLEEVTPDTLSQEEAPESAPTIDEENVTE